MDAPTGAGRSKGDPPLGSPAANDTPVQPRDGAAAELAAACDGTVDDDEEEAEVIEADELTYLDEAPAALDDEDDDDVAADADTAEAVLALLLPLLGAS